MLMPRILLSTCDIYIQVQDISHTLWTSLLHYFISQEETTNKRIMKISAYLYVLLLTSPLSVMGSDNDNSSIMIEDFSSASHSWRAKNDPVMGGKSTGSVSIDGGVGVFDGKVVDVPFLQAPGFITMETNGGSYPDVSSCTSLKMTLRASEEYSGYRVSFGNVHVPGGRFAFGYKADFIPPVGDDFGEVVIPFTDFSAKWDDATGDQIATCHDEPKYCPTVKSLKNLKTMSIWGEGVAGKIHLEIQSISAEGCFSGDDEDTAESSTAQAPKVSSSSDEITLESFDSTQHDWTCLNDPVMGGESTGTVSVESGLASFDGEVVDVPFLHAPGFITMTTRHGIFPDVSSCSAMKVVLMATEEYHGYRISFGNVRVPGGHHASGYKADFEAPLNTFDNVVIPFSDFSSKWNDATGDQIVTCHDDAKYCPDVDTLRNMETISIWGEGVAGSVKLKVKSISATGCAQHDVLMMGAANTNSVQKVSASSWSFALTAMVAALAGVVIAVVASKKRRKHYDPVQEIIV